MAACPAWPRKHGGRTGSPLQILLHGSSTVIVNLGDRLGNDQITWLHQNIIGLDQMCNRRVKGIDMLLPATITVRNVAPANRLWVSLCCCLVAHPVIFATSYWYAGAPSASRCARYADSCFTCRGCSIIMMVSDAVWHSTVEIRILACLQR